MSWSLTYAGAESATAVEKGLKEAAADALADLDADDWSDEVKEQQKKARAAAKALYADVRQKKVNVAISGHVGQGGQETDSIAVSVYGIYTAPPEPEGDDAAPPDEG